MTKPKKTEKVTRAVLTDEGKVLIASPKGAFKPAKDKTDWKALKAMRDKDIDMTDMTELDDRFWAAAKLIMPQPKDRVTLRLDHDLLNWLKRSGSGYQTRINAILRRYMDSHAS